MPSRNRKNNLGFRIFAKLLLNYYKITLMNQKTKNKKNTDLTGENFWKWDWFFIRNYSEIWFWNHIILFKSWTNIVEFIFSRLIRKKNIHSFISNNICQNSTARYCSIDFCSIRWIYWNQKLKLKLKTKIFFVGVYENLMTFLYTFD